MKNPIAVQQSLEFILKTYNNSWFMFHNQFKMRRTSALFHTVNVCSVVTFLTYYYSPTDLDFFHAVI